MDPREQLDSHRNVFLLSIAEIEGEQLTLRLAEGVTLEPSVHPLGRAAKITARPIEVTTESARYRVTFDDYIAYSVRDESYTTQDESEAFIGSTVRVYSKSHFLDYITASTIATAEYPGEYAHYEFVCCHHIVDIASIEPPEIVRENAG